MNMNRKDSRPKTWNNLISNNLFKLIPVQEGEGLPLDEVIEEEDPVDRIIRDPLGLTELDLRATQELHATGKLSSFHGAA